MDVMHLSIEIPAPRYPGTDGDLAVELQKIVSPLCRAVAQKLAGVYTANIEPGLVCGDVRPVN